MQQWMLVDLRDYKAMLSLDECQHPLFVDLGGASIEVGKLHHLGNL